MRRSIGRINGPAHVDEFTAHEQATLPDWSNLEPSTPLIDAPDAMACPLGHEVRRGMRHEDAVLPRRVCHIDLPQFRRRSERAQAIRNSMTDCSASGRWRIPMTRSPIGTITSEHELRSLALWNNSALLRSGASGKGTALRHAARGPDTRQRHDCGVCKPLSNGCTFDRRAE